MSPYVSFCFAHDTCESTYSYQICAFIDTFLVQHLLVHLIARVMPPQNHSTFSPSKQAKLVCGLFVFQRRQPKDVPCLRLL